MCWVCFPDGDQDGKAVHARRALLLPPEFNFYHFIYCCGDCDGHTKLTVQSWLQQLLDCSHASSTVLPYYDRKFPSCSIWAAFTCVFCIPHFLLWMGSGRIGENGQCKITATGRFAFNVFRLHSFRRGGTPAASHLLYLAFLLISLPK